MTGATTATRLLRLVRPMRRLLGLSFVFGVVGHLCAIGVVVVAVGGLASVANGTGIPAWLGVALGSFAVGRGLAHYAEQYTGHEIAFRSLATLRAQAFGGLRRLAPAGAPGMTGGELIARVMDDVEVVEVFFAHTIVPIGIGVVVSAIAACAAATLSPAAALLLLACFAAVMLVPALVGAPGRRAGRAYRDARGANQGHVVDAVRGVRELVLLGASERRSAALRREAADVDRLQMRASAWASVAGVVPFAVVAAAPLGVLALTADAPLAARLILTAIASASFGPAIAVARLSGNLAGVLAAGRRVLEIADSRSRVEDDPAPAEVEESLWSGPIAIDRVCYRYPGAVERALDEVTARIAPGRRTFLAGESGAGKTTLLDLILRYDDPESGRITIGGRDVRSIPLASLRAHIALVTQETMIFDDSIAANVRLARPDASDADVRGALSEAGAMGFVSLLPDGIETRVGPDGERLSGGERQRIGLARAALSGAPVVLLDEPTSNLDAETERGILSRLEGLFAGRTVVVTSHRDTVAAWAQDTVSVLRAPQPRESPRC